MVRGSRGCWGTIVLFIGSFRPFTFLCFSASSTKAQVAIVSSKGPCRAFSGAYKNIVPSAVASLVPMLLGTRGLVYIAFTKVIG